MFLDEANRPVHRLLEPLMAFWRLLAGEAGHGRRALAVGAGVSCDARASGWGLGGGAERSAEPTGSPSRVDSSSGSPAGAELQGASTLSDLRPGERAVVTRVVGRHLLRRRLVDLGLTGGTEILMRRIAPLGDPIEILVRGAHLSLRRQEAASIEIRLDSPDRSCEG